MKRISQKKIVLINLHFSFLYQFSFLIFHWKETIWYLPPFLPHDLHIIRGSEMLSFQKKLQYGNTKDHFTYGCTYFLIKIILLLLLSN